jgi:hypothetical protein
LYLQEKIAHNAIETSDFVYFNKFCQQFWAESGLRFAGFIWVEVVSPTKCYFRAI